MPHIDSFDRNGRWGTCSSCPRNGRGDVFPEYCDYTDRYDHQLTIEGLAEQMMLKARQNAKYRAI